MSQAGARPASRVMSPASTSAFAAPPGPVTHGRSPRSRRSSAKGNSGLRDSSGRIPDNAMRCLTRWSLRAGWAGRGFRGPAAAVPIGDRQPAVFAEGLGGDLDPGGSLAALVLAVVHHLDHPGDGCRIEALRRDLLGRPVVLDVELEDRIEHL